MITVAGLGVAGSYLLRRLHMEGFSAEGYDPKPPGYYIPCGYAVNFNLFRDYCRMAGLEPDNYLLSSGRRVVMENSSGLSMEFRNVGLSTIEKNSFERDLVEGLRVHRERAKAGDEVTVDATGISRSIIGHARDDFRMQTLEYLADSGLSDAFLFHYFPRASGYLWSFPLGRHFHVGSGTSDPVLLRQSLSTFSGHVMRKVGRAIRLRPLFREIVSGTIVAVGEAAGLVSPITGEGILPALESAEILVQCLKRYDGDEALMAYRKRVEGHFLRYVKLSRLQRDFASKPSVRDVLYLRAAKEDLVHFGIGVSALRMLLSLALT
ncbi:NAD(P)/FAD-dependent oxidoreductase [Thermogymnomonas acidicola]|uniref:NAD(P)/FAD-dependent oxidoreductase n=1 Tax=Thermogymnomonas acidicola TaxID=399579 RepID=UPI00166E9185|nr:tryptophan 7-halogenase [Thermogymnomonas acidicola]